MKKILIHFDKSKYDSEVSSIETAKEKSQHLIDSFNELKIGEFVPEKFQLLLFNTEQYLFESMMKDVPLNVNGMQLSKKQFYDMIEKPIGYYNLKRAVSEFILFLERRIKYDKLSYTPEQYLRKYLDFSENGKLEIRDGILDIIKESNSMFVTTDKGEAIFNFATNFTNFIKSERENLKILPKDSKDQFLRSIGDLINYVGNINDDLTVNIHAVKLYDK